GDQQQGRDRDQADGTGDSRRGSFHSVIRPQPGRCDFQGISVGIAEIQAGPAAGPVQPALYRDLVLRQVRLPGLQGSQRNPDAEMQCAVTVMRWNESVGPWRGFVGAAPTKQQQHLARCDTHRAHPVVAEECLEPEQALVEGARPIEVFHVEGGFEDAAGSRYRSHGLLHATGGFVSLARRRTSTRRATPDWPPTCRVRSRVRQKVRITGAHRKIGAAARRLRTRARRRSPRAGDGTTPHRTRAPRAPRRHLWDRRRRTPADGCERSWPPARTSGRAPGSPPGRNPAAGARPAPLPPRAAPAVPHALLRRAALRPHCPRERGWCRPARPRPRRSAPPHRWRPPALRPEPRPLPPPEWAPGKAGLSWLPPDSQPALAVRPFVKRLNRFGREGGGFALRGLRDDKR